MLGLKGSTVFVHKYFVLMNKAMDVDSDWQKKILEALEMWI